MEVAGDVSTNPRSSATPRGSAVVHSCLMCLPQLNHDTRSVKQVGHICTALLSSHVLLYPTFVAESLKIIVFSENLKHTHTHTANLKLDWKWCKIEGKEKVFEPLELITVQTCFGSTYSRKCFHDLCIEIHKQFLLYINSETFVRSLNGSQEPFRQQLYGVKSTIKLRLWLVHSWMWMFFFWSCFVAVSPPVHVASIQLLLADSHADITRW